MWPIPVYVYNAQPFPKLNTIPHPTNYFFLVADEYIELQSHH